MIEKLRELGLSRYMGALLSKMKDRPYFVSPRTSFQIAQIL